MKNLTKIFMAVAVSLFAFSCVQDSTEDLGVNINGQGVKELTLSLEESRTHLGEKAEGLYPLYWSEGDKISVNGVVSGEAVIGENPATATFAVEVVADKLCVVYPAAQGVGEGTTYPVAFAATQPYTEGSFASGTAPMYGYAADATAPIELKHLAGALRLAVKGNGEAITSVVAMSESGNLAGSFTVDCATGALTAVEATNTVAVTFAEPLVLGAEAKHIYFAVPAGKYGIFSITLHTETDKMTVKFDSEAKPINAGAVREFAEFAYAANTNDADDVFEIDSKEALIEFAKIAGTFYPRTKAVVTADIDMSGYDWTPIASFGEYEFDGGNCTIKGLNAPLFASSSATIKNVKLTDVSYTITNLPFSGAIVCQFYGSMDNCSASGAITINNSEYTPASFVNSYNDIAHAGLVGIASGASVTNCTNDIDIDIKALCNSSKKVKAEAGGVVGCASSESVFAYLVNNGDITYSGTALNANTYISGVIGKQDDSTLGIKNMDHCTNNGNVSSTAESVSSADILLAGITGTITKVTPADKFTYLTNKGAITLGGTAKSSRAAGMLTFNANGSYENCNNSGAITAAKGATCTGIYLSGLFSGTLHGGHSSNLHNTGNVTVEDNVTANGLIRISGVADGIGAVDAKQASLTTATNKGKITVKGATNTKTGNDGRIYASGITNQPSAVEMSQCQNLAEGVIDIKPKNLASGVMIGGVAAYISPAGSVVDQVIKLTDCSNAAAINVAPEVQGYCVYVGGITGQHWASKVDYNTIFTRVNNTGNITVAGGAFGTRTDHSVGGIMGFLNTEMDFEDCHNSGKVTFAPTGDNTGVMLGGFVGYIKARTEGTDVASASSFNNCSNSGTVTCTPTNLTGFSYIGGFAGCSDDGYRQVGVEIDTYTSCTNSGDVYLNGDGTIVSYFVGAFMGFTQNGATFTSCSATKDCSVNISVANVTTYGYSGWLAHCQHTAAGDKFLFDRCTNSSTTTVSTKNHKVSAWFSGLIGGNSQGGMKPTGSATYDIKDCVYDGTFNFTGKTSDQVGYGGLCQYPYAAGNIYTITNFKNKSTANISGSCKSTIAGGLSQYISATMIVDEKTEVSEKFNFSGTASKYLCYGGYWGNINHGVDTDSYKGTYSGTVTATGTLGSNLILAGISAQHKSVVNIDGVIYKGHIQAGTKEKGLTVNGDYIRIGGILSGSSTDYDDDGFVHDIKNVKSYGSITVENTTCTKGDACKIWIGGVWGYMPSSITGAESYCTITAIGLQGKVGMLAGSARTDAIKAIDCKVGGRILWRSENVSDEETGTNILVEEPGNLDASNWFKHIYSAEVTEAVAKGDGCELLTAQPTVQ